MGCYVDSSTARAFPLQLAGAGATVQSCVSAAIGNGLAYAGLQYGKECWGGNTLSTAKVSDSECSMPCEANPSQQCGASYRNSVYATGFVPGSPIPAPVPAPPPGPAVGAVGVWENVTPAGLDPKFLSQDGGSFGLGSIVTDPAHPSDMYVGGYGALFKSTDYGLTWKTVPSNANPGYAPLGNLVAVAGTTPATVWVAGPCCDKYVYKSIDGGLTFRLTGTVTNPGPNLSGFYSIVVDPNDNNHLLTGLHEAGGLLESTDGGETWKVLAGNGWPTSGISWYAFFINTGNAATTSKTWFAVAQDGGSALITRDGGRNWVQPKGIEGLQHAHGNTNLLQIGTTLFVTGTNNAGTFRSTDLGENWTRVSPDAGGIVWGSTKNLYFMWSWACSRCGLDQGGPQFHSAAWPGDNWKKWSAAELPSGLVWGPNSVATTNDGTHNIYVGSMWSSGLWRYVEP